MTARPTTARKRLTMAFRTPTGAIDLASIMVGVIVLAVIALGGVAATVFAVIPWAQDGAAKASLHAYQTAQSVAQAKDGRFMTTSDLVDHGYLPERARTAASGPTRIPEGGRGMSVSIAVPPAVDDGPLRTALNDDGSCYVANLRSDDGQVFYTTSKNPNILPVTDHDPDTSWCVTFPKPAPVGGLAISSTLLPAATKGAKYDFMVVADGIGALAYSATGLPAGLAIDSGTGHITGTPSASGTFEVTITAANGAGSSVSRTYPLTVNVNDYGVPVGTVVLNENFQTAKYGSQPAGWSVNLGGVTYPSGTTNQYFETTIYRTPTTFYLPPQLTPGTYRFSADLTVNSGYGGNLTLTFPGAEPVQVTRTGNGKWRQDIDFQVTTTKRLVFGATLTSRYTTTNLDIDNVVVTKTGNL